MRHALTKGHGPEQTVGIGTPSQRISLRNYRSTDFGRGRPRLIEALWMVASALLVKSWLPGSLHRRLVLRVFGARIGKRVVLKPGIRIKFPWRLTVGDDSWIGENAWIDNLAPVTIGANCCISQGAYICTGSHDWSSHTFDLRVAGIVVGDSAWIAARAVLGPGVSVGEGAVLALGSVATSDLAAWHIYQGVPAGLVKQRILEAPSH